MRSAGKAGSGRSEFTVCVCVRARACVCMFVCGCGWNTLCDEKLFCGVYVGGKGDGVTYGRRGLVCKTGATAIDGVLVCSRFMSGRSVGRLRAPHPYTFS